MWNLFCVRHGFSENSITNFVSALLIMFRGVEHVKNLALGKDTIRFYGIMKCTHISKNY